METIRIFDRLDGEMPSGRRTSFTVTALGDHEITIKPINDDFLKMSFNESISVVFGAVPGAKLVGRGHDGSFDVGFADPRSNDYDGNDYNDYC